MVSSTSTFGLKLKHASHDRVTLLLMLHVIRSNRANVMCRRRIALTRLPIGERIND